MWKLGPGKLAHLEHVVQELHQLVGVAPNLGRFRGLRNCRQVFADMVDATSRRSDDVVEAGEILHKKRLGRGRVILASAVGHRLATAGLIQRVGDLDPETFEQLQRRNRNLRKDCVDVTRHEQRGFHHFQSSQKEPPTPAAVLSRSVGVSNRRMLLPVVHCRYLRCGRARARIDETNDRAIGEARILRQADFAGSTGRVALYALRR